MVEYILLKYFKNKYKENYIFYNHFYFIYRQKHVIKIKL